VAHVGDIDDKLYKMGHIAASFLDQLADILHHLMGLLCRIMAFDISGIIKVLWALAAHPDSPSGFCYDGLAQIIIKILFGIGVFCVEFANTLVRHFETFLS
jgi:hypothetical protein